MIPLDEITWVNHYDWFRGPMNGSCMWRGEKCWYQSVGDNEGKRRYGIFDLTRDEWAKFEIVAGFMPDVWTRAPLEWFEMELPQKETS